MRAELTRAAGLAAAALLCIATTAGAAGPSDDRPLVSEWAKVMAPWAQMYLSIEKEKPFATDFGGNLAYSKLIRYPQLTMLWAGYPFSIDANEERGHFYIQADQMATGRNNKDFLNTHGFAKFGGQPTACMNCHTGWQTFLIPNTAKRLGLNAKDAWIAYNSTKYWTMLKEIPKIDGVDHHGLHGGTRTGVVCNDCHNPKNMQLRITRPALVNALISRGYEPDPENGVKVTQKEMRTLVCSQCHVEYYFRPTGKKTKVFAESIQHDPSKKWANGTQKTYDEYDEWRNGNKSEIGEANGLELVFPWSEWKKGKPFRIEMLDDYYEANRKVFGQDWVHKTTKAPMLKMQHPESEMFSGSVHAANGVACADCHMPKVNGMSQHNITSPAKTYDATCGACHKGKPAGYFAKQVKDIQVSVAYGMRSAEYATCSLIKDITWLRAELGKMPAFQMNGKADDAKITAEVKPVLEAQRKASIRTDFVGAENSTGFHNPREAARMLTQAVEIARAGQTQIAAICEKNGIKGYKASCLTFEDIQKLNPGSITYKVDAAGRKAGERYYKEADINGAAPKAVMDLDKATRPFNYKVIDK